MLLTLAYIGNNVLCGHRGTQEIGSPRDTSLPYNTRSF